MNKRCPNCALINHPAASICIGCGGTLGESENIPSNPRFHKPTVAKRASVCVLVLVGTLLGFYVSLIVSADGLTPNEAARVDSAITVLEKQGFTDEALLLRRLVIFRSSDNWLNASVAKENAYAATNFPFEIVTVYPDFFRYSTDDIERAAILLHEAKHVEGKDEKEAYEFVWKNKKRLGWTADKYARSVIWRETRKLTKEYSPGLFVCDFNDYRDCTD